MVIVDAPWRGPGPVCRLEWYRGFAIGYERASNRFVVGALGAWANDFVRLTDAKAAIDSALAEASRRAASAMGWPW